MKLDELTAGFDAFEAAIEANQGELTEELASQFEALNLAEKDKLDGYVFYLKALEGDATHLRKVADEILAKAKAKEKRREWLLSRVRDYMGQREATELQGTIFKFKLCRSGKPPVEVLVDPRQLPDEFTVREVRADKEALRRWLETNPPICSYARLGEASLSLRIF